MSKCVLRRSHFLVLSFLTLSLLGLTHSLFAQTASTGGLTGTVTDTSGAVVPNATVVATSVDSGQSRTATTAADGTYKFNLLAPGNYSVRFDAAGFRPVEVPSATVNVTETAVLDRTLDVGSQSQTVTVEGEVETIQTANSALGTVVTNRTATELPLNTRNYTNLLTLSAGANASISNATYVGKGSSLILVNGGGTAQNTYLQDGVSIQNWYSLGTGVEGALIGTFAIPNPDSISEFKIQTSTYDAGYGRNPGANVNVVTRSGTNAFHGTAFEFFRNTALNANDWFVNRSGGNRLTINQNQYGGVFGGPIKKDKLFFFVSYQETNQKNGASGYGFGTPTLPPIPGGDRGSCPTGWTALSQCNAAAQAFLPNLASAICPANHPVATGAPNPFVTSQGGIQVLCAPSAGSPLANINPVAINLLQLKLSNGGYLIPGSGTATFDPTTVSSPVIFKDHMGLGNFDWTINSKHTLSGRFEYESDPMSAPIAVLNATLVTQALLGSPVQTTKTDDQAVLRLTSVLSSSFVNEARISYQRFVTVGNALTPFTNSQVGIRNIGASIDQLSVLSVTGLFTNGGYTSYANFLPEDQFQAADQISWTHSKHTFRGGYEAGRVQVDHSTPGNSIGTLTFGSFSDFLIGRSSCSAFTGTGTCSATNPGNTSGAAFGNVNPSGTANGAAPHEFRATQMSAFVQDDYKLSPRLTLNLGVRWEYDGYISDKFGNLTNIWPSLVSTVPVPGSGCVVNGVAIGAGAAGTGCSLAGFIVPSNYVGPVPAGLFVNDNTSPTPNGAPRDDFAPRVGFAWQPTSSSRWVVRGGAGFFYDQLAGQSSGDPMAATTPSKGPISTGAQNSFASLSNPWIQPGTIPGPPGSYGFTPRWVAVSPTGVVTSSRISQIALSPTLTVPVTYEWNLNTQYEFLPKWVLELGYVGSHGIHQTAQSQSGGQGSSSAVQYNLAQLVSPSNPDPRTGATLNTTGNVDLRVPNLGIQATATELATEASYKYNSLQATVRRQMTRGLQLQVAYTWSRAFFAYPNGVNTFPYQVYTYGPHAYYHPHRLVVNYVWNLPLGHAQGFVGKVASGWTWSGVTTVQDGTPMTLTDSRGGTVFGVTSSNAQFCPGKTAADIQTQGTLQSRVNNYFAPGVFCAPNSVTPVLGPGNTGTFFGDSGIGIVRGPDQSNWDMSLSKLINIHEGQTLQFRTEFFNTFNHPQFNNPNLAVNSSTFGQISSTSVNPRIIQFALKYAF